MTLKQIIRKTTKKAVIKYALDNSERYFDLGEPKICLVASFIDEILNELVSIGQVTMFKTGFNPEKAPKWYQKLMGINRLRNNCVFTGEKCAEMLKNL